MTSTTHELDRRRSPGRVAATLRWLATYALFPTVFVGTMASATRCLARGDDPHATMATHMLAVVVLLALLERVHSYEPSWRRAQGDVRTDLLHLLVSNVGVATLSDAEILKAEKMCSPEYNPKPWEEWRERLNKMSGGSDVYKEIYNIAREIPKDAAVSSVKPRRWWQSA